MRGYIDDNDDQHTLTLLFRFSIAEEMGCIPCG